MNRCVDIWSVEPVIKINVKLFEMLIVHIKISALYQISRHTQQQSGDGFSERVLSTVI